MSRKSRIGIACAALITLALLLRAVWIAPTRSDRPLVDAAEPIVTAIDERTVLDAGAVTDSAAEPPLSRQVATETDPAVPQADERAKPSEVVLSMQPVTGCVVWIDGTIGSGLEVLGELDGMPASAPHDVDRRTTTDARGEFSIEFDGRPDSMSLSVVDARTVTVCARTIQRDSPVRRVGIVVAPTIAITGRVTDEGGVPIEDARLHLSVRPESFGSAADCLNGYACSFNTSTTTGSTGSFAFERAPAVTGSRLSVRADGFEPTTLGAPSVDSYDLSIRMARLGVLRGRVVHADGSPATRATVHGGAGPVRVDARGEFQLAVRSLRPRIRITAVEPGLCSVSVDVERKDELLTIVLDRPSFSIAGRVEDSKGGPLPRWRIGVVSKRQVFDERTLVTPEELVAGDTSRPIADEDGRFAITGLCADVYELIASAPDLAAVVAVAAVPVGTTDLVIRVPENATLETVKGVVRTRDGQPVAGARLMLTRPEFTPMIAHTARGHFATTDREGRFTLRNVPRDHPFVWVAGDTIIAQHRARLSIEDPRRADVVVAERAAFRVESSAPPLDADGVGVNAHSGQPLELFQMRNDGYIGPVRRMSLSADGSSGWIHVDADGAEIVFYRGAEVVSRRPIRVSAKEPTVIR